MSLMSYDSAAGLGGMLREGSRYYSNQDDGGGGSGGGASVVLRNIDACLQLTDMMSSSYGPNGRCKLVVNHLEKIVVTSDCASVLKEMEVNHPVVQLLVSAATKQEQRCGDNTNYVLVLVGSLLHQTALLIQKLTWQSSNDILRGYQNSMNLVERELSRSLVARTLTSGDLTSPSSPAESKDNMMRLLRPVMSSKQYGSEHVLAPIVAEACQMLMNGGNDDAAASASFNTDSVRTVKLLGSGGVDRSELVRGYVAQRGVETDLERAVETDEERRSGGVGVAVYACGLEASSTEAKGTVVMKTADDLTSYNRSEERHLDDVVKSIADSGVRVLATGGNVSDMALHFCNRYRLVVLRVSSKWELRRLCRAVGAAPLVRLGPPSPDEIGRAGEIYVDRVGNDGRRVVTVFDVGGDGSGGGKSKLATILLRASTTSVLNDLDRAVDDGVHVISRAVSDASSGRKAAELVYGGGAFEMSLSVMLTQRSGDKSSSSAAGGGGLERYAVEAFAAALQAVPRILVENAGYESTSAVLSAMQSRHSQHYRAAAKANATSNDDGVVGSICDVGVDVERGEGTSATTSKTPGIASMRERDVYDLLSTKMSALKLAVDTVVTILKIDQIIMSKPAGAAPPQQ